MIKAHGGRLINRFADADERARWIDQLETLPSLSMNRRETSDLEMIATGALSPLEGFMGRRDFESVCDRGRLENDLPWTVPITLSADAATAAGLELGAPVVLRGPDGTAHGILELEETYRPDKDREAQMVLRTSDIAHPGVAYLQRTGDTYLAGRVTLLERPSHAELENYRLDPRAGTASPPSRRGIRFIAPMSTCRSVLSSWSTPC